MLTLVLGGARSGKSRYAERLCSAAAHVIYLATARPGDDQEMIERIARHRADRPSHWQTVEAPLAILPVLAEAGTRDTVVLVDCVTLWLSNLSYEHRDLEPRERERILLGHVTALSHATRQREVVVVANELGCGLVPETQLGREFRDVHGRACQLLGEEAERVFYVVAGIPMTVKDTTK